ncbi:hypothetical protein [Amycolatopsis sp. H20-H5]|nr:hypothetical protein [Amycolatopsis sp. H20-H5]MEC3974425.1 hypothetical protein [Amycolatopsis sp. H20-H5]
MDRSKAGEGAVAMTDPGLRASDADRERVVSGCASRRARAD